MRLATKFDVKTTAGLSQSMQLTFYKPGDDKEPFDLTDCTLRGRVAQNETVDFTCELTLPNIAMITWAQLKAGIWAYDLFLVDPLGNENPLIAGTFYVNTRVTPQLPIEPATISLTGDIVVNNEPEWKIIIHETYNLIASIAASKAEAAAGQAKGYRDEAKSHAEAADRIVGNINQPDIAYKGKENNFTAPQTFSDSVNISEQGDLTVSNIASNARNSQGEQVSMICTTVDSLGSWVDVGDWLYGLRFKSSDRPYVLITADGENTTAEQMAFLKDIDDLHLGTAAKSDISDAVDSDMSIMVASSKAVKTAFDKGVEALNVAKGKLSALPVGTLTGASYDAVSLSMGVVSQQGLSASFIHSSGAVSITFGVNAAQMKKTLELGTAAAVDIVTDAAPANKVVVTDNNGLIPANRLPVQAREFPVDHADTARDIVDYANTLTGLVVGDKFLVKDGEVKGLFRVDADKPDGQYTTDDLDHFDVTDGVQSLMMNNNVISPAGGVADLGAVITNIQLTSEDSEGTTFDLFTTGNGVKRGFLGFTPLFDVRSDGNGTTTIDGNVDEMKSFLGLGASAYLSTGTQTGNIPVLRDAGAGGAGWLQESVVPDMFKEKEAISLSRSQSVPPQVTTSRYGYDGLSITQSNNGGTYTVAITPSSFSITHSSEETYLSFTPTEGLKARNVTVDNAPTAPNHAVRKKELDDLGTNVNNKLNYIPFSITAGSGYRQANALELINNTGFLSFSIYGSTTTPSTAGLKVGASQANMRKFLDLGTAAYLTAGTATGDVLLLGDGGKMAMDNMPDALVYADPWITTRFAIDGMSISSTDDGGEEGKLVSKTVAEITPWGFNLSHADYSAGVNSYFTIDQNGLTTDLSIRTDNVPKEPNDVLRLADTGQSANKVLKLDSAGGMALSDAQIFIGSSSTSRFLFINNDQIGIAAPVGNAQYPQIRTTYGGKTLSMSYYLDENNPQTRIAMYGETGSASFEGQITVNTAPSSKNHVVRVAELQMKKSFYTACLLTDATVIRLNDLSDEYMIVEGQISNIELVLNSITLPPGVYFAKYRINIWQSQGVLQDIIINTDNGPALCMWDDRLINKEFLPDRFYEIEVKIMFAGMTGQIGTATLIGEGQIPAIAP